MNLEEFRNRIFIKREKLKENLWIFVGKELGIMNIYINKFAEINKLIIKKVYKYSEIEKDITKNTLFQSNNLYVIYNDKDITEKQLEYLYTAKNMNHKIIIRYEEIDKRKKIYNSYENIIIQFNNVSDIILLGYMKAFGFNECSLRSQQRLIYIIDNDYNRLLTEIDKINILSKIHGKDKDTILQQLVNSNYFYQKPINATFDLIKAIMLKHKEATYYFLKNFLESKESILIIIKLLQMAIFDLLSYIGSSKYNKSDTDLNYPRIKNCEEYVKYWKASKLIKIIHMLEDIEIKTKTGKIDDYIALYYLLGNIYE